MSQHSNSKGLKPGMWCKSVNYDEWKAILAISSTLGLQGRHVVTLDYDNFQRVWYTDMFSPPSITECSNYGALAACDQIGGPEFIARMYQQAEINKKAKAGQIPEGAIHIPMTEAGDGPLIKTQDRADIDDHEKRIKALEEQMLAQSSGTFVRADTEQRWAISIDPKASPRNLPFEVALAYAKAGREIKRSGWTKCILSVEAGYLVDENSDHIAVVNPWVTSNDWEVVEK